MKDVRISIIIPVFNAAPFLYRCISGIQKQNFINYEVILIDDCSTDNSVEICKRYANIDKRIKFYQNDTNRGASATRNYGLRVATGEYIIFIDSDDYWLDCTMLNNLVVMIVQKSYPDFILFNRVNIDENGIHHRWKDMPIGLLSLENNSPVHQMTAKGIFPVSTGMKIYNRGFLLNNNLSFLEGVVWEDVLFYYKLLLASNYGYSINEYYYAACYNSKSVSRNNTEKKVLDLFTIIKECIGLSTVNDDQKAILFSILAYYYTILLSQLKYVSRKDLLPEIYSYKWLLDYSVYRPLKIISLINKVIGVKYLSNILSLYGNHKH